MSDKIDEIRKLMEQQYALREKEFTQALEQELFNYKNTIQKQMDEAQLFEQKKIMSPPRSDKEQEEFQRQLAKVLKAIDKTDMNKAPSGQKGFFATEPDGEAEVS